MAITIFFASVTLFLWFVFRVRMEDDQTGRCTYFDRQQVSAKEVFARVQAEVKDRQLPVRMPVSLKGMLRV